MTATTASEGQAPRHRLEDAEQQTSVRSRLWFRNSVSGIVVIAALAGLCAVTFRGPWRSYQASVAPAHIIAAGQSGQAYGQTWRLSRIRHLSRAPVGPNNLIPRGTQLFVVSIDRSGPVDPTMYCEGRLTDGVRSWKADNLTYSVPIPDGTTTSCNEPGPLQFTVLMPENVQPTAVDVMDLAKTDIFVRLEIPRR